MAFIESGKSFDKASNQKKMKARMENMDRIQYPLRLSSALHKKIKVKAAQEGKTIAEIFNILIKKYLE